MEYEQKMAAINDLCDDKARLKMVCPGDWEVELPASIDTLGALAGIEGGRSPIGAIDSAFEALSDAPCIIRHGANRRRRSGYRWTGFMWREVPIPNKKARAPRAPRVPKAKLREAEPPPPPWVSVGDPIPECCVSCDDLADGQCQYALTCPERERTTKDEAVEELQAEGPDGTPEPVTEDPFADEPAETAKAEKR